MSRRSLSRRRFLQGTAGAMLALPHVDSARAAAAVSKPYQAVGARVCELSPTGATLWTRLTALPARNKDGLAFTGRHTARQQEQDMTVIPAVETLEGACPGALGRVRVRYDTREDLRDAQVTDWADVAANDDYIHHFLLSRLLPSTIYHYVTESSAPGQTEITSSFRGKFETATAADTPSDLTFCVMTCQGYSDRDHPDGHKIYPAMQGLNPRFAVLTGDLVYYDNDAPRAETTELASYHWQRMFSLPHLMEFNRNIGTYWLKDDHDTLKNDSWPGQKMGKFTFAEGEAIFKKQAALGDGECYRTVRWGRDLQLWFTEGRDYRSPNNEHDGPQKTIWGQKQKDWFKRTVQESTATWKILVSPTPLVGPDRGNKNDNHANAGFQHEGDELRQWLHDNVPKNFFVICGDRHWQYDSIHPQTQVREFSVGPASDEHASGSPGEDKTYHQFHRQKGGFLSATLHAEKSASRLTIQLRDVVGKVVHEVTFNRPIA